VFIRKYLSTFERDSTVPYVSIERFSLTVTGRKEKRLGVRPDQEYCHLRESVQLPLRCPMSLGVVDDKINSHFEKGVADGTASFDMKVLSALDPHPPTLTPYYYSLSLFDTFVHLKTGNLSVRKINVPFIGTCIY
jgi:hypothetical protein